LATDVDWLDEMNSDKRTLRSKGGSILLRSAIVTVLLSLCSVPLLLLSLTALSGPIGFVLIITPMIILQLPLVWILVRCKVLPNVTFGRPSDSVESSSVSVSD
jgi:hypothetical protein